MIIYVTLPLNPGNYLYMYVGKLAISWRKTALFEIVFMMKLWQFQKRKTHPKLKRHSFDCLAWE